MQKAADKAARDYMPPRAKTGRAAAYLGISRRYLAQITHEGRLPFIRLGARCVIYDRTDLDAFLAANRVDPAAVTKGR
jgi:excisionase family DNA binding protein